MIRIILAGALVALAFSGALYLHEEQKNPCRNVYVTDSSVYGGGYHKTKCEKHTWADPAALALVVLGATGAALLLRGSRPPRPEKL